MWIKSVGQRLLRIKTLYNQESTQLDKCLSTFDLIALGVGSTLGVGIYVLSGSVAKDVAGPSVVLSFLIAGIASSLSGLCYAELGARVPKAGSAYVYSYVTVGEGVAFLIGWNLILEYAIGTASVARGYSGYLDSLLNKSMETALTKAMPINVSFLSPYPDVCAFAISMILTVILCLGVKKSTRFNNIFTILNIAVVVFVTIAGFIKADPTNWSIQKEDLPKDADYGKGGFFPYGISGTLAGAATCFYGYVGFDTIATSGEETQNPQFSIPVSIYASLFLVFLAYLGVSSSLTLMVPYYMQDPNAPLPFAFMHVGWDFVGWLVAIGALFGLSTSLLGSMFPLPRVLYAMSSDGLMFRWLADIHPKFQTPLRATILSGLFTGLMAMFFDLKNLVDMMSIGTLMAYTIVAVCVVVLRYKDTPVSEPTTPTVRNEYMEIDTPLEQPTHVNGAKNGAENGVKGKTEEAQQEAVEDIVYCSDESQYLMHGSKGQAGFWAGCSYFIKLCANTGKLRCPTCLTSRVASFLTLGATILCTMLAMVMILMPTSGLQYALMTIVLIALIVCMVCLARQPTTEERLSFKVPLVPLLPMFSVFINIYLMMKLSEATWIRFAVWLILGVLVYGCYGWHNASEEYRLRGKTPPNEEKKQLLAG